MPSSYSGAMLVALACDASPEIGTGHVTRCVAVAEELASRGHRPVFVGSIAGPAWLLDLVAPFEVGETASVVPAADVTLLDAYASDALERIRAAGVVGRLAVVADDATPRFPADAYLEPGVNVAWEPPDGRADAPRLAGPEAALIRRALLRGSGARRTEQPGSLGILVTLGGGDGFGMVPRIVEAVSGLAPGASVAYVGPAPIPGPGRWVPTGPAFREELAQADIVLTAGGVTSWESLHHGRPTGVLAMVGNQAANYDVMAGRGVALGLGRPFAGESLDEEQLARLLGEPALRAALGDAAWKLVDGRGAQRAVDLLEQLAG